jgi:hypothetical protein
MDEPEFTLTAIEDGEPVEIALTKREVEAIMIACERLPDPDDVLDEDPDND